MSKKAILVTVAVVAVAAIFAAVAYAYWFSTDSLADNVISTGGVKIEASDSAMSFTDLMPTADPANGKTSFMHVYNPGPKPIMFYAYATLDSGTGELANYAKVKITLAPGDYPTGDATKAASLGWNGGAGWPVYEGPLANIVGAAAGKQYLKTETPSGSPTPLLAGQYALYKVQIWLDKDTPNDFQNRELRCSMIFVGGQEEGWPNF
jgi:hypothetical protein